MTSPHPVGIPEWTMSDRFRKSMTTAGIGVSEMADYFGISRNTVSSWINGRVTPPIAEQRLWALRCGVPYEWLRDGIVPDDNDPDGGEWAPRGSNPQPTDYKSATSGALILFPQRRLLAAAA